MSLTIPPSICNVFTLKLSYRTLGSWNTWNTWDLGLTVLSDRGWNFDGTINLVEGDKGGRTGEGQTDL